MGFLPFGCEGVFAACCSGGGGTLSVCAGEGVWGACQLANFSTCRLVDLSTCRVVGLLDCWVVGLLAGSGDGGEVILWRVCQAASFCISGMWGVFLVFWESNLAIRHCNNFKFSYSDFPHSLNMGVDLHPVDNPLKTEMTTPAKWDVNSRNPR